MSARKQHSSASGTASNAAGGSAKKGLAKDHAARGTSEQPDEEPLLAVILADSYNDHFAPLTLSWPRCLLPLANVPLLHYSIESATRAGVQQICVLTRAHAQRIRQHVQEALQDILQSQGITITVMSTPEALSEGDALRELDAKQIVRSDFLLFRADSVCTMDLRPVVDRHRQRRVVDKDVIMTTCCMPVLHSTPMRSNAIAPVQYVDPKTDQVLHYETLYGHPKRKATMPFELLQLDDKNGCEEIDVRHDLVEAGVYVCSIDVPPLFSENFDYQSLQVDFIPGILTSDLLESKILLHIGKRGYGGRAQDTQTYDAITRDVLRRWTNPFTPGTTGWIGERMTERRGWRYVGQEVASDRTSSIGPCSMIASRCTLGSDVKILQSVLCDGVQVGKNSEIQGSHLHTSVVIGSHVKMTKCIIGRNAKILDNVVLGRGCLIGADCIVGPNVRLADGSRVGIRRKETWDDEEEREEEETVEERRREGETESKASTQQSDQPDSARNELLGSQSRGVLWPNLWRKKPLCRPEDDSEEEEDDEDPEEDLDNLRLRAIGFMDGSEESSQIDLSDAESISSIDVDSEYEVSDPDDDDAASDASRSAASSNAYSPKPGSHSTRGVTNLTLADEGDTQLEKEAINARIMEFEAEARASLTRALEENHSIDNASLELKTLRMASNVAPRDVQRVLVNVLLEQCKPNDAKQVQALFTRWGELLVQASQDDEMQTLQLLQSFCADHPSHFALFVPLLKLFYNEDILSDESIFSWWRSKASQTGGEKFNELRVRAQGVVRHILESNEDDSEEESE